MKHIFHLFLCGFFHWWQVKSWKDILKSLIMNDHTELQYRGMLTLANVMEHDKEMTTSVVSRAGNKHYI